MNIQFSTRVLMALATAAILGGDSLAQRLVVNSRPTAGNEGNWTAAATWNHPDIDPDVPPEGQFNEVAVIGSGGTVTIDSAIANGAGEVIVNNGQLHILNGGSMTLTEPAAGSDVNLDIAINSVLLTRGNGTLAGATLDFGGGATYNAGYAANTTTPLFSAGLAELDGALILDFNAMPTATGLFNIIDAGSTAGAFDTVTAVGLNNAKVAQVVQNPGGVNGQLVQALVSNQLTLTANRTTGAVTVSNTHGTPLSLDGLRIQSGVGSLAPGGVDGLGAGWTSSSANSANSVTQLFEGTIGSPNDTINAAASRALSSSGLFVPATPTAFLEEVEDLTFSYTGPDGVSIPGVVNYVGDPKVFNNIVLTVDPTTGEAAILNTSNFSQQVEAYRITSEGGSLSTSGWDSLDAQGIEGGDWLASSVSDANELVEIQEDGTTTFSKNTLYNIGDIFNLGVGVEDLTFEFLLAGDGVMTTGEVVYGDLPVVGPGVVGDYNDDGVVDSIDYALWRENLGGLATSLENRDPANTGPIGSADFDSWKDNFGAASGSGSGGVDSVPEPASVGLLILSALAMVGRRRSCHAE